MALAETGIELECFTFFGNGCGNDFLSGKCHGRDVTDAKVSGYCFEHAELIIPKSYGLLYKKKANTNF